MANEARGVAIFAVPYDSGHRGIRMGDGPEHLLSNGLENALAVNSREVRSEVLEAPGPFRAEIATAFELFGEVADRVCETTGSGDFPLVLSGNCNATVGAVAGLAGVAANEEVGIVWFDGHADFNTPETTTTGFLDGMGLAIAVGQGWANMTRTISYFRPAQEANVVLIGGRGASPVEKERLRASNVTVVEERRVRQAGGFEPLGDALNALGGRVRRVHVHLDLDVLDPTTVGPANEFAPEGGLSAEDVEECIQTIRDRLRVASATVASYDPSCDREGRVLRAGIGFARTLVA
jgi:arginase